MNLAIEKRFNDLFAVCENTILEGGGVEPQYLPSPGPGYACRIIYREDFAASALHEIAHWCIASGRRRQLTDYGYWYYPARDFRQQAQFERVEARPQALECLFSEACGLSFSPSADNLAVHERDDTAFAAAIEVEVLRLRQKLPPRAQRFVMALGAAFEPGRQLA